MYVYIYDEVVKKRKYNKLLINIEKRITDLGLNGKIIQSKSYTDSQFLNLKLEEPTGIYLLIIESGSKKAVIRLVKK